MQTKIECFPCFLKQTIIALRQKPNKQELYQKIIKDVLIIMHETDISRPPAYTTTFIHRAIRNGLGADPFKKIKYDYNNIAMQLYPKLRQKVNDSKDPLWMASRLAIAGNIIDFGIFTSVDIESSIIKALESNIAADEYQSFRQDVHKTKEILYLLDNSGEIVFDKLLIEELVSLGKKVKAVAKGAPVLNDATKADAEQINLESVCEVIDNGSDAVGTIVQWTSPEFQEEFCRAELIISKGQGNFETLTDTGKKIYFLFQSKCDVVSKELGLLPGSMLFKKS